MERGSPIDWAAFGEAGTEGRFMNMLVKLPRERWTERDKYGLTLLHLACRGPNMAAVAALLQSGLLDVNAPDGWGNTPAHEATWCTLPRVLEVLCTAGADLRAGDDDGYSPIDLALQETEVDSGETVRVLMANGVRLSAVHKVEHRFITPELEAFEYGVLRCRAAVMAMLRVKKAGQLWRWDKFLLREVAIAVWTTRYDDMWQN